MGAPLTVDNGYLIGQFGGVRALLDTGAPVSFGDVPDLVVEGIRYRLPPQPLPLSIADVRRLSRADVDVLVGSDILAQHPFTLDTARGEITFGDLPAGGHVQRVGLFMGSPYLTVELAGQRVPCILDTGANIALLPSETRWPVPVSGERADFDPVFGAFVTPVRRCRARVLGHDLDLDLGEVPAGMQALLYLTPVRGLMGMELLKTGRLGFDLGRRLVAYEPRQ